MFEVVLKQDYEDIFFFRELEVNGVTNNTSIMLPNARCETVNSNRRRSSVSP